MTTTDQPTLVLMNTSTTEDRQTIENFLSAIIFDPFERYRIDNRLSWLREQRYKASHAVARDLNMSSGLLYSIERGDYERFSLADLDILARYYGIHPLEILRNAPFGTHETAYE